MSNPLSVFIGYDAREHDAYQVAQFSLMRRASKPVMVMPLVLSHLSSLLTRQVTRTDDGKLWCPISQAPMSTEFAISRFCVPFIQRSGWALFMDCDVLCLADISALFQLADDRYAVMVVKHNYVPEETVKMDGQVQTTYPRKNWSSVILWNCGHPANLRLTKEQLNTWPGRDLHGFKWLKDEEIGQLPIEWNYLVGISQSSSAKLLHFTLGGAWIDFWPGGPYDSVWLEEKKALNSVCGNFSVAEFA
jgi:hypothetical protein